MQYNAISISRQAHISHEQSLDHCVTVLLGDKKINIVGFFNKT